MDDVAFIPAYGHGGNFPPANPIGVVIHCTEGPLNDDIAESLMGPNWFGGPQAGTSIHYTTDSNSIVQGVKVTQEAWHVGTPGNHYYIGFEFCGRVAMTKEEWRSPPAMDMLRIAAPVIAEALKVCGGTPRWLKLTEITARVPGMLTHNDVRLAWGGTTHSDPGPNFPYAELLSLVADAFKGDAQQIEEDVALSKEDIDKIVVALMNYKLPVSNDPSRTTSLAAFLKYNDSHVDRILDAATPETPEVPA